MANYFVRYSYIKNNSWIDAGDVVTVATPSTANFTSAIQTLLGFAPSIEIMSISAMDAGSGGGGGGSITPYNEVKQTVLNTATTYDINPNTAHSVDIVCTAGTGSIKIDDGVGGIVTSNFGVGFSTKYEATELISTKISIDCPNTDAYIIVTEIF